MALGEDRCVSLDALMEQGNNSLEFEDFDLAIGFYERALDIDAKAHAAYWGILLAERQCRKASELARFGCIDNDKNYELAVRYADEAGKKQYEYYAKYALFTSHLTILEN